MVFSAFGLREGFYYSRLSEAERARHPLIAFAEEQGAGWRRFDLAPSEIFDWLTPVFAGESEADRVLRTAACHLSDISWNDHPDYRAEQAYIRVLHLPAPGMSHRERAILAMTLAYRYKSDPKSAMLDTALRLSDGKGRTLRAPPRRLPQARLQPLGRRARPAAADPAAPHRSRAAADRAGRRQGQPGRRHGPAPRERRRGVRPQAGDRRRGLGRSTIGLTRPGGDRE